MFPLISVIIPTFNRASTIKRAVMSVLNQTYENIELLVIDDASTDETSEILSSVDDSRLKYFKLRQNLGANHARNVGIQKSSGDYIAFQDSDDEWLNQKLEKQVNIIHMSENEVEVVYSGFIRVEDKVARYFPSEKTLKSGMILGPLLEGNFVTTQSALIKRDCFSDVGLFDEKLRRFQDWELFIRLATKYEFYCVDEPLVIAYHSQTSISADHSLSPEALVYIFKKHQPIIHQKRKDAIFSEKIAISFSAIGYQAEAFKWYFYSLRKLPFRARTYCLLCLTLTGSKLFNRAMQLGRALR